MDWKNLFFSGNGRIGRQEFWIGVLILLGVGVVLGWIPPLAFVATPVLLWCWTCLYAKRLHDMGKSGWLVLLPIGVSVVATIFAAVSGGAAIIATAMQGETADPTAMIAGMGAAMLALGASALVCLIFLLWVGLSGGQAGENRFGPAPGAPAPVPA